MNGRQYMLTAILVALPGMWLWPLINWRTDTSRVLHRDCRGKYEKIDGNVAFLKVAWILDHPGRYDSFVLGSSRVRYGIPVDGLGDNWYKLEYPYAYIGEHIYNLRLLLDRGVSVRRVILALDDFVIYGERDNASDYFYRLYPRDTRDWLDFYRFYLFKRPQKSEARVLLGGRKLEPTARIEGEREGRPLPQRDTAGHAAALLALPPYDEEMTYSQQPHPEKTLHEIRSLVALCRNRGIRLDVLVTPRHCKTFYSRDYRAIARFCEALALITPFWDFSGLTDLHVSPRYWHDTSHFTPDVGRLMLDTVMGGRAVRDGFGTRITPDSAQAFYRGLYENALEALPGLMAEDAMISPHDSLLGGARPVPRDAVDARRGSLTVDLRRAGLVPGGADLLNVDVNCSGDGAMEVRREGGGAGRSETRPLRRGRNRIFVRLDSGCVRVELLTSRPLMYPATVSARLCAVMGQ